MKKKRNNVFRAAVVLLCLTFLSACSSVGSYTDAPKDNNKNITEIKMTGEKTGYGLDQGKAAITYDGGKSWVPVPGSDVLKENYEKNSTGFYITPEITAIAYGGAGGNPVTVMISTDKGAAWSSSALPDNKSAEPEAFDQSGTKFIGFNSPTDGWIVTTGEVAMGSQHNFVYQTSDGGKTWTLSGSTNKVYSRVVTGAGFADKKTGFIGFRYEDNHDPIVYMTRDGGKTWSRQNIALPEKYKDEYATPLSPTFDGADGELPVSLSTGDKKDYKTIRYTTTDYGVHWIAPAE